MPNYAAPNSSGPLRNLECLGLHHNVHRRQETAAAIHDDGSGSTDQARPRGFPMMTGKMTAQRHQSRVRSGGADSDHAAQKSKSGSCASPLLLDDGVIRQRGDVDRVQEAGGADGGHAQHRIFESHALLRLDADPA